MLKKSLLLLTMAFFSLLSIGCNCQATRLNVTIDLDPAMKQRLADLGNRELYIDLIVLNGQENSRWENYSMTEYWAPQNEHRDSIASRVYTMKFSPSSAQSQSLSAKDPVWDKWMANISDKDIPHLYVLAQIPGMIPDQPSSSDPRRQILPLCKDRWEGGGFGYPNVKMLVGSNDITTVTSPKPEKK